MPSTIYLIGGCNRAGKTTFARDFLPSEVKCLRFLNADEIARGLSPACAGGFEKAAMMFLKQMFDGDSAEALSISRGITCRWQRVG